jgi:hypothetical protein
VDFPPPGLTGGNMGGDPTERLQWKNHLHSLEVELQSDFGLSPVASRALIRRIEEFIDNFTMQLPDGRAPGQISYPTVAIGERAGKPIRNCLTIPTKLTLLHESDADVLHNSGTPSLRRARVSRFCNEAYQQGTVLSHEDLALLLSVDSTTVRRLISDCAEEGTEIPTRGSIEDIGPGITHKEQVIALFFRGLFPAHIAARIGHRLGSVERYLTDFARIVHLKSQGVSSEVTIRITGLSPKTVNSYLDLLERYGLPEHRPVFERLIQRFCPLEEKDTLKEVEHG